MHFKSSWRYINKGLLVILSFLVVSTLASIFYLTQTLTGLLHTTQQSGNAVGTVFILQDLLINLQDIQTSTRGFVLTGNETFIAPYDRATADAPADLRILRTNKGLLLKQSDINDLERLSKENMAFMAQVVSLRREQGFESAQAMIISGKGESTLQGIRDKINGLSTASLENLGPMQSASESNTRRALAVAGATSLLVLGTCVAVAWYFKRAILHERALESTKNEFLSLASHQLRTPATNVKLYLGMLLDGYMGKLTEEQRNALDVAYKNNDSEISIMNNLLDVAKLDLNRIQLHKRVVNVMKIAKQVVKDITPKAREKSQSIRLTGSKQVMALVDEEYIRGVIENLVDNAIKYSHRGTEVHVSINRVGENVQIRVRDKGIGIRKRDMNKLFNKFSRLPNEFSANSEGSGLGLYWVKQIVTLHDGTIDIDSHEGKGSEFTVVLPVR